MKKKFVVKMIVFVMLFAFSSIGAQGAEKKAPSIGKIVTISGKVQVKKAGAQKFVSVDAGYAVLNGDTLRVGENAKATVAFKNGSVVTFPAASDTVLSDNKKSIQKSGSMIATIAKNIYDAIVDKFDSSKEKEKVSMVAAIRGRKSSVSQLYPKNEAIIEDRPLFTWKDSIKGRIYRVSIYDKDGLLWSATTDRNELLYPDAAPVLEKGRYYFWQVIVDGEPESEIAENAFLSIIPDEQASILKNGESELTDLVLAHPSDTFSYVLLGSFYESFSLYAHAIAQYDRALELSPSDKGIKGMRDGVRNKQGFLD